MYYVTDAHSLIWYLADDKRLGKEALSIFEKVDAGEITIIVPTIALAEIIYICEKKQKNLKIKEIVDKIKNSLNYIPYSLNMEVLERSISLTNVSGIHDRLIVATTKIIKAKLISKDKEIIESKEVEIVW